MFNTIRNSAPILILLSTLAACSSTPRFDVTQVDKSITPNKASTSFETSRSKKVLWGGTILDVSNLKDNTQIEVLAYPLNTSYRPQLNKPAQGRFIIRARGYVESASYTPGKQLTVLGELSNLQSGKIGERSYNYPVVQSQQLHLWAAEEEKKSSFHFGIGIGIHN